MAIRILIVDDHQLVRAGIKTLLTGESDMQVVGEAGDGRTALEMARELRPDVVVLDLRLPDMDGVTICRTLQEENPEIAILALSTFTDADLVVAAARAGVRGYLVKDVQSMELKRNIRAVARGEVVIDPKVAHHLLREVRQPETGGGAAAGAGAEEAPPLTRQQLAIIRLVAEGYTNREIAQRLYLSEKTVKGYLAEAMRRLQVKNRVEAAMVASKRGWL